MVISFVQDSMMMTHREDYSYEYEYCQSYSTAPAMSTSTGTRTVLAAVLVRTLKSPTSGGGKPSSRGPPGRPYFGGKEAPPGSQVDIWPCAGYYSYEYSLTWLGGWR